MDYLEEFDGAGEPAGPGGTYWYFVRDIHPDQGGWTDFCPGDGFAYITLDSDTGNDLDPTHPFQMIVFGLVGPGHRLETRMKGALVPGVTGFLFTYWEDATFDEIDIELVADDAATAPDGHPILPPDGWSDARFNTWGNSDTTTYEPSTSRFQPIVDARGDRVSHMDDRFHVYTIDWFAHRVEFRIDGVHQQQITFPIADSDSEVLIGFRDVAWAGDLDWPGTRTMVVDWLNIQPIDDESPIAAADEYRSTRGQVLEVGALGVLANDTGTGLAAVPLADAQQGALILRADGSFTYTPAPGFTGVDTFVYRADDGTANGESNAAVVTVHVSAPAPPEAADDGYCTLAGRPLQEPAPGVLGNDVDPNGDPLTVVPLSGVSHGTLDLETDGSFTYTPDRGHVGADSFTYRADDGTARSGVATATIDVNHLNAGLLAHWPLDGDVRDSSEGGMHGTPVNGPLFVAGRSGRALSLSGGNQHVQLGGADVAPPWTASLWVRRRANPNTSAGLIDSPSWSLRLEQWDGTKQVGVTRYGVADWLFGYTAPEDVWVHLVFAGTASGISLYVDGDLVDALPVTADLPMATIGKAVDSLIGELDDVAAWNRALCGAEIRHIHDLGLQGESFRTGGTTSDLDGDGVDNGADCHPTDGRAWSAPSEVRRLTLQDARPATFAWAPPAEAGGTRVLYDLLRSRDPAGFAGAVCLESDGLDTAAVDSDLPGAGSLFFYLVGAENDCGPAGRNLGSDSAGAPRTAPDCP